MSKKTGARNFMQKFYKSKSWKAISKRYRQEHPYCERCLAKGIYTPSQLVHHKVYISMENRNDYSVLMDDSNLEALCRQCHADEHYQKDKSHFDEEGALIL